MGPGPAAGFRQPYYVSAADGSVLNFAGLYDRWKNPETCEHMTSCTIIVTDANELMRPIHDRMPPYRAPPDIGPSLNGEACTELLRPASEGSPTHVATGVEARQ